MEREGEHSTEKVSNPAISFAYVSKRYFKDSLLLEEVSFEVPYGNIVILVGPSGSGKSTVLQMASALLSPDSGEIRIDGNCVYPKEKSSHLNVDELRRSLISYLPQDDYLLESLSVFENVALALDMNKDERDRDTRVAKALEEMGILGLRDKKIHEISAGERRRSSIARALVRNPKILIADEPTSSLDAEKTSEFMKTIKMKQQQDEEEKGHRKMAILIASHDVLELEPFADKIFEIRNCTLVERSK